MIYVWLDDTSKKHVEVQRKLRDIDIPPDKEECLEQGLSLEDFEKADWEEKDKLGDKNRGGFGSTGV